MKFKKIEFARQTNFILALLLIHFVFFGYLSNFYAKNIGESVLFLYQVLFLPSPMALPVFWLTIIVALIIFMGVFTFVSKIEASDKKSFIILLAFISCVLIIPIVIAFPVFQGIFIQVIIPDFSVIILAGIVFLMAFRERFFEYGIRNSIWLIPFIIVQSWIWYWFIIESFDISVIWGYFIRIESYITILTLLGINILAAILAAITRERLNTYRMRVKKIEV